MYVLYCFGILNNIMPKAQKQTYNIRNYKSPPIIDKRSASRLRCEYMEPSVKSIVDLFGLWDVNKASLGYVVGGRVLQA